MKIKKRWCVYVWQPACPDDHIQQYLDINGASKTALLVNVTYRCLIIKSHSLGHFTYFLSYCDLQWTSRNDARLYMDLTTFSCSCSKTAKQFTTCCYWNLWSITHLTHLLSKTENCCQLSLLEVSLWSFKDAISFSICDSSWINKKNSYLRK